MIQMKRPSPPADFSKAPWKQDLDAWEQWRAQNMDAEVKQPFKGFTEHWIHYRGCFQTAQHGKCGYCETFLQGMYAVIDHFAPKGKICHLDPQALGETPFQHGQLDQGLRGRREELVHEVGYGWLAYSWENWVLSCEECNTSCKRSFFHVGENPHPVPSQGIPYTPLLLNPFDDDPEPHLQWDSIGYVIARNGSVRGQATVDILGLWRANLVQRRAKVADDACRLIDRLVTRKNKKGVEEPLGDLVRMGEPDQPYAAVVRGLMRDKLYLEWDIAHRWNLKLEGVDQWCEHVSKFLDPPYTPELRVALESLQHLLLD